MASVNGVVVRLSSAEIQQATEVGLARRKSAIANNRPPANNIRIAGDDAVALDILGCLGEKAVSKLFPFSVWHSSIGRTDLPDIDSFIDVKTPRQKVGERPRRLIAYVGGVKRDWAYVLALRMRPSVFWIVGWAWGSQLIKAPTREFEPGRPAHYLDPRIPPLYPMTFLQLITSWKHDGL
jgi:hypothetical protein